MTPLPDSPAPRPPTSPSLPVPPAAAPASEAPPAPPAVVSGPPGADALWNAFRRRWFLATFLGLAAAAAAAAAAWVLVPGRYTAQTLLQINPRPPRAGEGGEVDPNSAPRALAALVKSQSILRPVLERPEVAELSEVRDHGDPFAWLQKEMTADFPNGPEILRVSLNGDRPEDLAVLLNETARQAIRESTAKEEARIKARIAQLKGSYRATVEVVRGRRLELAEREKRANLPDPALVQTLQGAVMQKLNALTGQLLMVQQAQRKARQDLADARDRLNQRSDLRVSPAEVEQEVKLDPRIAPLYQELARIELKIVGIRKSASPASLPGQLQKELEEKQQIQGQIDLLRESLGRQAEERLRARLIGELEGSVVRLQGQIKLNDEEEGKLNEQIAAANARLLELQPRARSGDRVITDIEALRDEVQQAEQVLKTLGQDLASLEADLPVTPRLSVLEPAAPPSGMNLSRRTKLAGAAGLAALFVVLLAVTLAEFRGRRVYGPDDVTRGLGLSLVGTLPAVPAEARKPLADAAAPAAGQTALLESVDGIRALVLHAARTQPLRVIMVTSAAGGEGKTTLACHLAASLARNWRRTLLIDADLRNPSAHARFDLPPEPGLSEVLRSEVEADEAIKATPLPRLSLLPAGRCDRHAIEGLSQDSLGELFERLGQHFDFIVVDVSPVLPVADALQVGQHADAAIFSVLRHVSRLPDVYAAQQRLAALHVRVLGAVVIGDRASTYGVQPVPLQLQG
jgi:capsular exopolysaccharide synthesis family protein